jgi:hypothetical protein
MTLDQFWTIIEDVHRDSAGDMDAKCDLLGKALRQLPLEEIASFDQHFTEQYYRAYDWGLWAAAYIIGGGCSDDSFSDFRATLISMGRETFERALADPQSLADMDYDADNAHYEGFQYVTSQVYEELNGGKELPPRVRPRPKQPAGREWPENKVGSLYPKLAAKYDYKD